MGNLPLCLLTITCPTGVPPCLTSPDVLQMPGVLQVHSRKASACQRHPALCFHDHCQLHLSPHCLLQCICLPGHAVPGIHFGGSSLWRSLESHGHPHFRVLWLAPLCLQLHFHSGQRFCCIGLHALRLQLHIHTGHLFCYPNLHHLCIQLHLPHKSASLRCVSPCCLWSKATKQFPQCCEREWRPAHSTSAMRKVVPYKRSHVKHVLACQEPTRAHSAVVKHCIYCHAMQLQHAF